MLQALEDTKRLDKLLGVPAVLAYEARNARSVVRRIQKMQIAVAIELLLCAPIRLGNLSTLKLGEQLPKSFSRRDRIHLSLSAQEVKNGRSMLLPVAASACALLDEYVGSFRPLIAKPDECSLFVGDDGHAKSAGSLRDGIVKAIKRHVGIRMTPHQFRHLAGELILRENLGAYGLVQQVLGHINLKTTMNFYAADHSRDAGRVLDGIVTARRQRTKV
jgi:integrase